MCNLKHHILVAIHFVFAEHCKFDDKGYKAYNLRSFLARQTDDILRPARRLTMTFFMQPALLSVKIKSKPAMFLLSG